MNTIPEYITPGAIVRLRDGSKVRIYATDGLIPIHGAIWIGSGWVSERWYTGGVKSFDHDSPLDIVGPWIDEPDASKLWPLLPPWIGWLARDRSGSWFGYEFRPAQDGSYFYLRPTGICISIPDGYAPTFTGDWKDSLCERPKS